MAEQLNYQINIEGNANQSVGSLKKQLREAQAEVSMLSDKFGATSKEAIEAAKRAAELRDRIGDAKALTEAFNPDAKFKALSSSLSGVAGGFAAIQGAIGLFGAESKELEKQLLKVQSALALSQGLQSIGESIDAFRNLGAVIETTTVFQKANAAANAVTSATLRALGIAAETTAISFRVLKTAIAATGILAAVVVISELVTALIDWADTTDETTKANKKLNDELERQNEILSANASDVSRRNKVEIARLKAQGADEAKIRKQLLDNAYRDYTTAFEAEQEARKLYNKALDNSDAETLKKFTDNLSAREKATKDAYASYLELGYNQNAEEDKQREENSKKQKEKRDKDNKDALEKEKQKNEKILELQKEQADRESAAQKVQIEAYRATLTERDREILKAEDEFEEKKGELIKAGVFDFTLVQEQYRLKVLEINAKYDKEEEDKLKDKLDKEREIRETNISREVETRQLNADTLKEKQDAELFALSKEYELKYELAVKNGEDLALLTENFAAKEYAIFKKYKEEQQKLDEAGVQSKINALNEASAVVGALATLSSEQTQANRAFTLAQIGIDTAAAIASLTKNSEANPTNAVTFGASGAAQFAAGLVRILANIKKAKDLLTSSSNISTTAPSTSRLSPVTPPLPQATLTQLNQASINALGNSAIRAYVVETDITASQQRIAAIKQRARFG
jgi:hypothetical protein